MQPPPVITVGRAFEVVCRVTSSGAGVGKQLVTLNVSTSASLSSSIQSGQAFLQNTFQPAAIPAVAVSSPRLEASSARTRTGSDGYARFTAMLEAGVDGFSIPGFYCNSGNLSNALSLQIAAPECPWSTDDRCLCRCCSGKGRQPHHRVEHDSICRTAQPFLA